MATSPNYAWAEPDNSSLVKNGAADIRTLGDAIDTSVWNVGYGQAGKNKIINGNFGIWQRGTTFTANGSFTADRYRMDFSGTGTAQTVTQQSFTAGAAPVAGYESQYFVRNAVTGGTGTGSLVVFTQKIEDVRTYAGQTVTLSFWAKSTSGTPSIGLDLYQDFGSGGSSTVSNGGTKVAITTSWTRYSATISLASISGKTIGSGSHLGARLWFSSGSDFNSLNGSLGLQSNTFDIWGMQLEVGSKATPFQTASGGSPQAELAMCQRYYWQVGGTTAYTPISTSAIAFGATSAMVNIPCPVTMRTNPTSVNSSTLRLQDNVGISAAVTSITLNNSGPNITSLNVNVASGLIQYRSYLLETFNSLSGYLGVSAEL